MDQPAAAGPSEFLWQRLRKSLPSPIPFAHSTPAQDEIMRRSETAATTPPFVLGGPVREDKTSGHKPFARFYFAIEIWISTKRIVLSVAFCTVARTNPPKLWYLSQVL